MRGRVSQHFNFRASQIKILCFHDYQCMLCFAAVKYVKALQEFLASLSYGSLASLMGRYYAMDRDKRYERTKIAFEALVQGDGEQCLPEALIGLMEQRYAGEGTSRQTDEFMKPIITDKEGCIGGEEIIGHGAVVRRLPPDVSCDEAQLTAVCLAPAPKCCRWRHTALH